MLAQQRSANTAFLVDLLCIDNTDPGSDHREVVGAVAGYVEETILPFIAADDSGYFHVWSLRPVQQSNEGV